MGGGDHLDGRPQIAQVDHVRSPGGSGGTSGCFGSGEEGA